MSTDLKALVESSEALKMLRMVTMNFYDNSRIALNIFQALGVEWDEMAQWSKELHLEIFPQTCTWSMSTWEELYGITTDERLTLEVRRQQLMAKVLYRAPINPESLRVVVELITGANEVVVTDFTAPYTFEVSVKHNEAINNMTQVWEFLYNAKPSHLSFNLYYHLVTEVPHKLHPGLHYGIYRDTDMLEEVVTTVEITKEDWIKEQEENKE